MNLARRFGIALLVASAAAPARAEDPPKFRNEIAPEATAAIEKFKKLVYRPVDHGLKTAAGEIVPIGLRTRARTKLTFDSTAGINAQEPSELVDAMRKLGITWSLVRFPLQFAYDASDLFSAGDHDAALIVKAGRPVLVLDHFQEGKWRHGSEYALDDTGLVTRRRYRTKSADDCYTATYGWTKSGEAHRLDAFEIAFDGAIRKRYVCEFTYGRFGELELVTSYEMTCLVGDKAPTKLAFRLTELAIDGTSVDLRAVTHGRRGVTPAARAAIERFEKLVYRPTAHGLESASGFIVPENSDPPLRHSFEFKAPNSVTVRLAPGLDGDSPDGRDALAKLALPFRMTLGVFDLIGNGDYDADIESRDDSDVFVATSYLDGRKSATDEAVFDAAGLVVSVRHREIDASGAESSFFDIALAWSPVGEFHQLIGEELTSGVPGDPNERQHVVYAFRHSDVDGVSILSGFDLSVCVLQPDGWAATLRVEDLVVNGKKVPARPAGESK